MFLSTVSLKKVRIIRPDIRCIFTMSSARRLEPVLTTCCTYHLGAPSWKKSALTQKKYLELNGLAAVARASSRGLSPAAQISCAGHTQDYYSVVFAEAPIILYILLI